MCWNLLLNTLPAAARLWSHPAQLAPVILPIKIRTDTQYANVSIYRERTNAGSDRPH